MNIQPVSSFIIKEYPPVTCFLEMEFKKKKCCKEYKKGDQCRKCPRLKAIQA